MNGQNSRPAYLDFDKLDNYLAHLKSLGVASTRLECKARTGQPDAELRIKIVDF